MALETLEGVTEIGGYKLGRNCEINNSCPIVISHPNHIEFQIQDGPIKDHGVNGCQVDTIIEAAQKIIMGLDEKFPCAENQQALGGLSLAIAALRKRKADREARGVEGTSND